MNWIFTNLLIIDMVNGNTIKYLKSFLINVFVYKDARPDQAEI